MKGRFLSEEQGDKICTLLVQARAACGDILGHAHSLHYHADEIGPYGIVHAARRIRDAYDTIGNALAEVEQFLDGKFPVVAETEGELRKQLRDSLALTLNEGSAFS